MSNQPNNYNVAMGLLQVMDVLLNLDQVSNDTILEELQRQNKEYLEKIVKQNEEIIGQNATIIAQGRNLYQMQEKIWEQMGEMSEDIGKLLLKDDKSWID